MENKERAYADWYAAHHETYKHITNLVEDLIKKKLDEEGYEKIVNMFWSVPD